MNTQPINERKITTEDRMLLGNALTLQLSQPVKVLLGLKKGAPVSIDGNIIFYGDKVQTTLPAKETPDEIYMGARSKPVAYVFKIHSNNSWLHIVPLGNDEYYISNKWTRQRIKAKKLKDIDWNDFIK